MKSIRNLFFYIATAVAYLFSKVTMTAYAAPTSTQYTQDFNVATATGQSNGGTLDNNMIRTVYSREIEWKALPTMLFNQFATEKTELGREPGLTIAMMTYNNIALGGILEEGKTIATQAMTSTMKDLTVFEHGNAISVTEMLIRSSFADVMRDATTQLGRDYAKVLNIELRDVALSGTNRVYGGGKSSRGSLGAADKMTVSVIKDAIEVLSSNDAPKYGGNFWICFVHPHQSRDLRDDPAWINASNYGNPELLFNGEIGRIDDTRFIETTLMTNGASGVNEPSFKPYLKKGFAGDSDNPAVSVDVYQAVIFGDQYYAIAWSLPVELRDNGVEDFGRKRSIGWYAIWGSGILNDEHGVVLETA